MTQCRFRCPSLGLGTSLAVVLAGLAATPALAATTPTDATGCSAPPLSQPFLSANDSNWYTLAPGQTPDSFNGDGWTLTAGAKITTTPLAGGQIGFVLDLPSGSTAVSPPVCVTSDYPTARTMVRNVVGAQGVRVYVSYASTNTWAKPQHTGRVDGSGNGWTLSQPIKIYPGNVAGWQLMRFTFVPGGHTSDFQIYNFYVDPRMGS
jgi:hypothetical protein